jgi:DNA repair exonuclease SbcCD nuclease subunit
VPYLHFVLDAKPFILDGTAVFPVPLLRRHNPTDRTAWIRSAFDYQDFPADLPPIVLAHGRVQGFEASQEDEDKEVRGLNRIALERMSSSEIDYIALGDWHGTKQINQKVWYSGTPEIDCFPKGGVNGKCLSVFNFDHIRGRQRPFR